MGQVTIIKHEDGTETRVATDDNGRHHVERTGSAGGGHQYGEGRSHDDVVRNHTDPGDRVARQQD